MSAAERALLFAAFSAALAFGTLIPVLPVYLEASGTAWPGHPGALPVLFLTAASLSAPLWGRLSDRIGRRPVLLISNAGSAISYGLFAFAATITGTQGLLLLLASRVFAGICGANLSVASAYIADVTTPENRSKGMGLIGVAFGLGFILGPAISGFTAVKFGLPAPGWVAAGLCTLNFLLGCFILVESRRICLPCPESYWRDQSLRRNGFGTRRERARRVRRAPQAGHLAAHLPDRGGRGGRGRLPVL